MARGFIDPLFFEQVTEQRCERIDRYFMSNDTPSQALRILVVDDNPAIHEDFRKILHPGLSDEAALADAEAALFGEASPHLTRDNYHIDFVLQGEEALAQVRRAQAEQHCYAIAFIDVRMPPGWDGIETVARIWEQDPDIQTVVCTAYSDYSWDQIRRKLGQSDRLVVLMKPFDPIEVLQLTDTLSQKWRREQHTRRRFAQLERMIDERARELKDSQTRLDAARRQLAELGKQGVMNTQRRRQVLLQQELQQALEAGELSVHYQPLFDIATREIVSLEALVRWERPQQEPISPSEFIPVAEQSGLILPLGEFVLRTVCEQIVCWQHAAVPTVPVAVNISAVQLQRQNIKDSVQGALRDAGLRPQQLVLELTETALIANAGKHVSELQGLRDLGVGIEIDDFGTGYSSLSYLKHLPVDSLKIDRSFISGVSANPKDEAIVSAVLVMAHSLGLKVIAEGVETADQLEVLRRHGCEFAQGFFFSKPLPAERCRDLLLDLAQGGCADTQRLRRASGAVRRALALKQ